MKLAKHFYRLQRPFLLPSQRTVDDEDYHQSLSDNSRELDRLLNELITTGARKHRLSDAFLRHIDRFNHELAFGTATVDHQPTPGGYQPVKINGMVTYRISGLLPPDGQPELCGQVWTLTPEEAIDVRQQRNQQQRLQLNVCCREDSYKMFVFIQDELIELLHRLMANQAVGHPLARMYQHLRQIYDNEKRAAEAEGRDLQNFRIRLLDRNEVLQR